MADHPELAPLTSGSSTARSVPRCPVARPPPPCCGAPPTSAPHRTGRAWSGPASRARAPTSGKRCSTPSHQPERRHLQHRRARGTAGHGCALRRAPQPPRRRAGGRAGRPTTATSPGDDPEFLLVLTAGERRSFTANTIIRDPAWRKRDADGALRMSAGDAAALQPHRRRPGIAHHQGRQCAGRRGDQPHDAAWPHLLPNGLWPTPPATTRSASPPTS